MTTKKAIDRKITTHKEKMKQMASELKKLEKLQKAEELKLNAQRAVKRGALLEKELPNTAKLDDARFLKLIEWTASNEYVKKVIAKLLAEQAKETPTANLNPDSMGADSNSSSKPVA